ncbi:hypothetical protein GALMADRAFT_135600 [Galerina marginata CBS 339.88]|uniref:Uncharacterized protein n=1 Tax=Galerina marginata (strain CBS 339.88) TaxID=685588 RepID=A0A067TGF1_GALM3|nr:hypothetical protein GALMADRAFT_135600 [Galerina marginata CBS 339.88]
MPRSRHESVNEREWQDEPTEILCGDPSCRNHSCLSHAFVELIIYHGVHGELPLNWHGRFNNGYFVFANDRHLRHITNASSTEFMIYSPFEESSWGEFDQFQLISSAVAGPLLLRAADYPEKECLALPHFVKKVHRNVHAAPAVPAKYLGVWDVSSAEDSEMGSENSGDA